MKSRIILFTIIALLLQGRSVGLYAQLSYDALEVSDSYTGKFAIRDERFGVWDGRQYVPLFLKGINLGVSVPGTQPGQLAATREDYRRWFALIREAGYNTIRTYTLHYPRFYEELSQFNQDHPECPLLLIQGVWLEEQDPYVDLFQISSLFNQEIREVVSAIHGDITIESRPGKADGVFTADVSRWVAGFLIGREIFPEEVSLTNQANPGETTFQGSYLALSGEGDPVEVWFLKRLDSLMIFEQEQYGTLRPAGISTWPTMDPLEHPTEALLPDSQEDDHQIDLAAVTWPDTSGGFFIGYHAYPYYPDFIVQDPVYNAASDDQGPNSYLGYLTDLKAHYNGIPLVIAEYGVPTSWGSGHLTGTGMNHGGISEQQQGSYTVRMLENITDAGCAGGIQFSLIDEWFKQTWITNPYSESAYRHFWHNITAPEQNFGILSFVPPPERYMEAGSFPGEPLTSIRLSSDYTFFRVRLYMDTEAHAGDTLWVAFDTYAGDLGESRLPDGTSIGVAGDTLRAEFALRIPMSGEYADLYVIPSYDVYGVRDLVRIDTVVSARSDLGAWNPVRWKTNYFYDFTQYIGRLKITNSEDPYQFLNAVALFNDSLEIRIPWTLLNFTAPTVRRAMHYLSYYEGDEIVLVQQDTLSDGIAVSVGGLEHIYQSERYSWDFWDYEKIQNDPPLERKKSSFFELKRELPRFNSPPVGLADSFALEPGGMLDVGMEQGLLSNDYDIDGNQLEALLAFGNAPANGTLELHPGGSFFYTPAAGFRGEDSFSYYLHDGYTYSALVPVTLNVNFPLGADAEMEPLTRGRYRIYPNPGETQFFVKGGSIQDEGWVEVTDPTGRVITQEALTGELTGISIEGAAPGVYIFTIHCGSEMETHRVIKQ